MSEGREKKTSGEVARLLVFALGFGCFMGYSRMLALGFEGFLDFGTMDAAEAFYTLRSIVRIGVLVVLAIAGWKKLFSLNRPLLVCCALAMAASTVALPYAGTGALGAVVALVTGASNAVIMYAWVLLLSAQPVRRIVQAAIIGIVVAGALIMGAPHLHPIVCLVLVGVTALLCGLIVLWYDPTLATCVSDGPLERAQVASIPWFAVIVFIICGVFATLLYGVASEVTWRYGQEANYIAFGLAAVSVVGITSAIMLEQGDWSQAVWVPLFVLFLVAVVFACFATAEALEVSVGLLLGCVFSFHFLRFMVFPAMLHNLEIPRSFLSAMILIVTNSFFVARAGEWLGSAAAQGMRGLAQVAGLMAVVVLALFALMVVLFMRRPSQAAVVTSVLSEPPEPSEPASPEAVLAARLEELAQTYGLTEREIEVAGLSAQGFNAPYIADKLVVSQSTVRFHLQNVYRKMGIHSRSELIEIANLSPTESA